MGFAVRLRLTCTVHVKFPPERVFPLLCPVREYGWIPTWRGGLVYSDSGLAEDNCIFKTNLPGQGAEVWGVSHYELDRSIQFVRFGGRAGDALQHTLNADSDGGTTAEWMQILTGLSGAGNRHVAECDEQAYCERIAALERMLNHYLTTGQMLQSP